MSAGRVDALPNAAGGQPAIQVAGLGVRLGGVAVVKAVDFAVPQGDSLALWGENGAGKTTILKAMMGLLPYGGRIVVNGLDAKRQGKALRRQVGYVPQHLALYNDLSAGGYLDFIARLRGVDRREPPALLARVGLAAQARKAVGALSGGMKQRLALAAALVGDPPVLVLDEPTASLDAAGRADIVHFLGDLRRAGKTLLVTSHRFDEVAALADRALVLEAGAVKTECPSAALADALGLTARLHLEVAADALEPTMALLAELGYKARLNSRGVWVEVRSGRRAEPLAALIGRGIEVTDLNLEEAEWTPEA